MGELTTTLQNIETKLDNLKPPTIEIFEHDIMWFANTLVEEDGKLINRVIYDSKYWTCTKQDFQKILKWDSTNKKKYIPEQYDCDNFAMSFKSRVARYFHLNNVGLVIDMSSAHAYNITFLFSNL